MKKILSLLLIMALSLTLGIYVLAEPANSQYALETLSEDWTDFQFSLNGQAYQLPLPVSIFLEDGWELEDSDTLLTPNSYTFSQKLSKDGMAISVQILNAGIDVLPASQCLIGEISIEAEDVEKGNMTFALAGGITFGSTKEEVIDLYGTPKDAPYVGSLYEKVTYSTDIYEDMDLYYDLENQRVIEMELRSFATPQGYNDEAMAAPVEVPEEVTNYKAAEALGEDPLSFNVMVDDVVYTLPAPYQYFEEKGWKLADKTTDKQAAKDSRGRLSLLYAKGYNMDVRFINPSDKANILANCFVSSLIFEDTFPGKVEFPGGITLGMSHDDLKKAIDAFALTEDELKIEEGSSYIIYNIRKKVLRDVEFYVNRESDAVYKIEIINNTSKLDEE